MRPASGEHDLSKMLSTLEPVLSDHAFVYCVVEPAAFNLQLVHDAWAIIREDEGVTVIIAPDLADKHGLSTSGATIMSLISLSVHSSLEAVGLTAAISTALADAHVSANVIAANFHDHILVPKQQARLAMDALVQIPARYAAGESGQEQLHGQ